MPKIPLILLLLTTLLPAQPKVSDWNDAKPKAHPNLNYTYKKIPEDKNGFNAFTNTIAKILENDINAEALHNARSQGLTPIQTKELTQSYQNHLADFTKALEKPNFQAPLKLDYDSEYNREMNCIYAAYLFKIIAQTKLNSNPQEAYQASLNSANLSNKMLEIDGPLVTALCSQAVLINHIDIIYELCASSKTNADQLTKIAEKLPEFSATQDQLISSLKIEFQVFKKLTEEIKQSSISLSEIQGEPASPSISNKISSFIIDKLCAFYLQPNLTTNLAASIYKANIDLIKTPLIQQPAKKKKYATTLANLERGSINFLSIFRSNLFGELLIQMSIPPVMDSSLRSNAHLDIKLRLTTLLIATRQYHIDHRTLPEKLTDLSPKYLKKIPLDPYTGKPFTYNKAQKTITSAGPKEKLENPEPFDPKNYNFSKIHNQQTPTLLLPF